jgi:hypothetical protein
VDRRNDMLAICFLLFAAVLSVWLGIWGPTNTTTWKEWQPIMASVIALGGAGIVFRGATLAYRAAMAKVDQDRELHLREVRRKQRGVYLRVAFAALVLEVDAAHLIKEFTDPTGFGVTKLVNPSIIKLRGLSEFEEAWTNLDLFPGSLANSISSVKIALFNVEDARSRLGTNDVALTHFTHGNEPLDDLRQALEAITSVCKRLGPALRDAAHSDI